MGGRYAARSSVWRAPGAGAQFELVAEVETQGATDVEHFVVDGRHYVAFAEEGNLRARMFQRSFIYQILAPQARSGEL